VAKFEHHFVGVPHGRTAGSKGVGYLLTGLQATKETDASPAACRRPGRTATASAATNLPPGTCARLGRGVELALEVDVHGVSVSPTTPTARLRRWQRGTQRRRIAGIP
jgi:hypothetical protein